MVHGWKIGMFSVAGDGFFVKRISFVHGVSFASEELLLPRGAWL